MLKKLRWMFTWFFILNLYPPSLQSYFWEEENEEGYLSRFIKRVLSPCFGATPSLEEKDHKMSFEKPLSPLESLPLEIFHLMSKLLSPFDIVRLSQTSQSIREKLDDRFWEDYIRFHGQESWNSSVPCIRVALAYSYLERGNIIKAAHLGHPKAINELENKNRNTQAKRDYHKPFFNFHLNHEYFGHEKYISRRRF